MYKLSFTLLLLVFSQVSYAEFYMATRWDSTDRSYKSCILEGKDTLRFMGFKNNLDHDRVPDDEGSGSVWGKTANYSAIIRCLPNQGIVFFTVAGKNPKTVKKYINGLKSNFSAY